MTAPPPVVGPYHWEDFVGLPDDDRRELIDGEFVEVEVPRDTHERTVTRIICALGRWADEHERGASSSHPGGGSDLQGLGA